jgi:putative nucleotidyltransferase with HDIG domain
MAINHGDAAAGVRVRFGQCGFWKRQHDPGVHRSNTNLIHRQADLFGAAVRALISTIEAKDPYTLGHSERVARVAVCLADRLRLSKSEVDALYLGGLLHDIGKIGVDNQVLNKPGALTTEEFAEIKRHPQLGYDILRGMQQLEPVLPIVLHHHEAWTAAVIPTD